MKTQYECNAGCLFVIALLSVSVASGCIFGAAWGFLVFGAVLLAFLFFDK